MNLQSYCVLKLVHGCHYHYVDHYLMNNHMQGK
jgi:hypothetical protein